MKLTVKDLKEIVKDLPDDMPLSIGVFCHDVHKVSAETVRINFKSYTSLRFLEEDDD